MSVVTLRNCVLLWIFSRQVGIYACSAAAFAFLRKPPPLANELGCSPTLSVFLGDNFFFDPLNLASDEKFARYREAELKHGRVAMLATVGMVMPNILIKLANQIDFLKFQRVPCGLNALKELPLVVWVQIIVTCGFLELAVFCQRDAQDMPGDYGTGYFGLRDKGRNERALQCELENGRLAMIAFVGQVALELITERPIIEQWQML